MSHTYLIDSHCHLNYPELKADLPGALQRAREVGVGKFLTISTEMKEFPEVLKITQTYPDVFCTIGVHPHEAEKHPSLTEEELKQGTLYPKVVGLGETGLDYYYEHSPKEIQKQCLRAHIHVHQETELPLVIHSREGEEDLLQIFKEEKVGSLNGKAPGVIHCFSGTEYLAEETLAMGFYISISGIVTFKKAETLREIVKKVPLDRLLVETDAPFLAPVPHRGKPNEPAYVVNTAYCVAEIKNLSLEELKQATTENFYRLFWKVSR